MKLLRAADVAEILGVKRRTAMKIMRQMPLVNIAISGSPRWAVDEADLKRWIDSRKSGKPVVNPLLIVDGHLPKKRPNISRISV